MSEEHQMETQLAVDGELSKSDDSLRVSQECLQCSELSQESQCSVASISLDTGNTDENAIKKKKVKKTKKKKMKTKKKEGENNDIAEKSDKKSSAKKTKVKKSGNKTKTDRTSSSSSTSKHRPEPEGGNSVNLNHMDEYDRVIYGNEPLFSDLELSGGEGDSVYYLPPPRQQSGRNRPGGIFVPGMLGINSSTMIKFAIIETELKNILRVSLKRVGPIDLECKILP
ncbi:hypothetical protein CHS0354_014309 [Potamilus streckersoni]|uniref:Uncharacterized protein n=1 Tax=Potamilus streckersoni TaxID=2493646 RepID=A0AAE0SLJ4_9BIVA|nr:hypothetical protein CHS0354_014309 [Potamilus streckersoni]